MPTDNHLTPARLAELRLMAETAGGVAIPSVELLALVAAADRLREVEAERDAARQKALDEMYLRGNQLAAISTVLMSNTPVTLASVRLPKDHALYTAAFQDAIRAVEREIGLRKRLESITFKETSHAD